MFDDRVPAHQRRQHRKTPMRETMAFKIVDEPAAPRLGLHEAQKSDQLRWRHVMRDQAADHDVPITACLIGIIAGDIADR